MNPLSEEYSLAWIYRVALVFVALEFACIVLLLSGMTPAKDLISSGGPAKWGVGVVLLGTWGVAGYLAGADTTLPRWPRRIWHFALVVTCFVGAPIFILWGASPRARRLPPLTGTQRYFPSRASVSKSDRLMRWVTPVALSASILLFGGALSIDAASINPERPGILVLAMGISVFVAIPLNLLLWVALVLRVTSENHLPVYHGGVVSALLCTTWIIGSSAAAALHLFLIHRSEKARSRILAAAV